MCNKCNCNGNKKKPHKHAEIIKAWADGVEIQYYDHFYNDWIEVKTPMWGEKTAYRIKPEVKPDITILQNHTYKKYNGVWLCYAASEATQRVKWTVDGVTGRIKSVELLDV